MQTNGYQEKPRTLSQITKGNPLPPLLIITIANECTIKRPHFQNVLSSSNFQNIAFILRLNA